MLLLNHIEAYAAKAKRYVFTFQYASIKPKSNQEAKEAEKKFTFQYASIKPGMRENNQCMQKNLHFNMLLLNLISL